MQIALLAISKIFNILLFPFKGLPQFFGFSIIALITGFLAVLIFKHVSNQKLLKAVMKRIKLHFTEIILYKDDIRLILSAQRQILKQNFIYFVHTIKPALPIVAIVLLILSQINIRYSIQSISPGEPVTVKVKTSDIPQNQNPLDIELDLPESMELVTPAFHIPGEREIEWRIRGKREGGFVINFRVKSNNRGQSDGSGAKLMQNSSGDQNDVSQQIYRKDIIIGPFIAPFSPHLGKKGILEPFFNPLEELLPKSAPIESIDIGYKPRYFKMPGFGLNIHWLVAFLVIAILFGLICRKILKVS